LKETTMQKEFRKNEKETVLQKPEIKCISIMLFEEKGKTIFQPLITGKDAQRIQELFNNETLEIWLPNGASDPQEFDVGILKYKQLTQSAKRCSLQRNLVCLKNHIETIVSCEQCPISANQVHE